jgi:hypothetical protein
MVNEQTRLRAILRGMGAQLVISIAFLTVVYGTAAAFPITIDPGTYTGQYSVAGRPAVTGSTTIAFGAGTYSLEVNYGNAFLFNVDAAGQVSSQNATAAHGSGSTLVFHTTTISIDPTTYPAVGTAYATSLPRRRRGRARWSCCRVSATTSWTSTTATRFSSMSTPPAR